MKHWLPVQSWRSSLLAVALALPLFASPAPAAPPPILANPPSMGQSDPASAQQLAIQIGELSQQIFDAADARQWPQARTDIRRLRASARRIDGSFEARFSDAGGRMERLYSARNHISGDLAEADAAASTKDRRWLMDVANRLTLIAGELAQPFADAAKAPLQLKADTAMFLARRMRIALAWNDTPGYQTARQDLRRIWTDIRKSLPPQDGEKARALDAALDKTAISRDPHAALALQRAAQAVIGPLSTLTPPMG